MGRRRVDRLSLPCCRAVTHAVVRGAEMGAALDHTTRNRLAGKEFGWRRDAQALRGTARARGALGSTRPEPVRRPLPDVAAHVEQAVSVRREASNRRGTFEAVAEEVLPGKLALPRVRHRGAAREVFISPCEHGAVESAACRVLPLCFRRELLVGPRGIRLGVFVRDVYDRVLVAAVDGRAFPRRALPESARDVLPPVAVVVEADGTVRLPKDERAGR